MRNLTRVAVMLLAHIARAAAAQEAPAAGDLTVLLASTNEVRSVKIAPVHATMRLCVSCAAEPVPQDLMVRLDGTEIVAGERRAKQILFDGALRAEAEGQQFAAAGHWRITPRHDGLHLGLTMPSERYVQAVLMAESAAAPMEALKAQAVVVRTYALLNSRRHGLEGLCDSTHCQALRLQKVSDAVQTATLLTAGETLWHGSRRAETYFTQSCGGTSTTWPGQKQPWLVQHSDPYCQRAGSSWRAAIPERELRDTLARQGWRVPQRLSEIRIGMRDRSGRVMKLLVDGTTVSGATFRFAVNRQLGWNRIRSDLYQVSRRGDEFVFEGRGFGHGVGLCQAGATEMAREGTNYRQILSFYFPRTQVRIEPEDEGWREAVQGSARVRSTVPMEPLSFGDAGSAHFSITVYPTTELFRQATGQPGWVLGSTVGQQISLQPLPVLARHGGFARVARHEWMHAILEQEAAPSTPLWLREGLAEVLSGEDGGGTMPLVQMERALRAPASQAESDRAHRAAAAKVNALVQRFGLTAVRGWLRSGQIPPVQ